MEDIINSVLENKDIGKATTVNKEIDVDIDEGTLLVSDFNIFDNESLRKDTNAYVHSLTRDNVQLLINKIWSLKTERVEEAIVAHLPKPKYILPRARCVPKPKPLTKWQQFAKEKGIRSKKKGRSKLKWDDELRKWIPTFGYKRAKEEAQKEWLVEMNDQNKPKEDPMAAASKAKVERKAKNELQRLRNIARAKKVKIPRVGLPSTEHFRDAKQLGTAVTVARVSTASVGKFQARLPKEKDAKDIAKHVPGLKPKRKAPPVNVVEEKRRNTDLANSIFSKPKSLLREDPVPTVRKAKSSGKSGKKGKTAKKPKAGKGKRDLHTKVGGRKRRH